MALAFWLPFYAAGPKCQLWQFMTNKHFYIAFPAIYCSVFCTYQQPKQERDARTDKQRGRQGERGEYYIICYIYFERHRWLLSLWQQVKGEGRGYWLWYSAFVCINVWKTQITQQTNKQTDRQTDKQSDNKQSAALSICASSIAESLWEVYVCVCVYNARRRVHGI